MNFSEFNSTGELTISGNAPQSYIDNAVASGVTTVVGNFSQLKHYYDLATQTVVEYTAEEQNRRSNKPCDLATWDMAAKQWIDPRTPSQVAEAIQAEVIKSTQLRLDTFAQTRNYDGILSACTYATSAVSKFALEGQCCVTSRDATWAALYTILAEIQAGTRPMPTSYADIEPLLPALTWTN